MNPLLFRSYFSIKFYGEKTGTRSVNWAITGNGQKYTESWATGVEWVITKAKYGDNDYHLNSQDKDLSYIKNDNYTPIVIDMIDNHNQYNVDPSRPNDRVSGYTLGQLEQALPSNLENWYGWRDNIKKMYNNSTKQHVDYLFTEYLN